MPVLKAVYNEAEYSDYTVILDQSGYYYLARTGNDKSIKISTDELKKLIKVSEYKPTLIDRMKYFWQDYVVISYKNFHKKVKKYLFD